MKIQKTTFITIISLIVMIPGILRLTPIVPLITSLKNGGMYEKTDSIIINRVLPDSPASNSGLSSQDRIIQFDGKDINDTDQLVSITNTNRGKLTQISVMRSGVPKTFQIIPRKDTAPGEGPLGVELTSAQFTKMPASTIVSTILSSFYSLKSDKYSSKENIIPFFISGFIALAIGVGLYMRKWRSLYGYFIFAIIGLIQLILLPSFSQMWLNGSQFLKFLNIAFLLISAIYLYKNRGEFTK